MKTLKNLVSFSICAIAALVIFAGCSSEEAGAPFAPTNESEQDIGGLVLLHNGKPIIAVDNENVYCTVDAQMNQNSDVYEVEFYYENGELINNESQKYKLAWTYEDSEFATFEQPEDLNEWEFHIHGKKPGDTTFQLLLENQKSVDYSSPSIPLTVR